MSFIVKLLAKISNSAVRASYAPHNWFVDNWETCFVLHAQSSEIVLLTSPCGTPMHHKDCLVHSSDINQCVRHSCHKIRAFIYGKKIYLGSNFKSKWELRGPSFLCHCQGLCHTTIAVSHQISLMGAVFLRSGEHLFLSLVRLHGSPLAPTFQLLSPWCPFICQRCETPAPVPILHDEAQHQSPFL